MNPNSIPWSNYQDLQVPDIRLQKQFNNYIKDGKYDEASALLRNNKAQLLGKSYIKDAIQPIVDGIAYLEDLLNKNVYVFLSDLFEQHSLLISEFRNAGEWDRTIKYGPYNFAFYDREMYMAYDYTVAGVPPVDGDQWVKLGLIGRQGAPGIDVSVKYGWGESISYTTKDIVSYNGDLYVAIKPNKGVVPDTDSSIWLPFLIVSKGKINISVTPPTEPLQNMIWFKVESDPTIPGRSLGGEMYRYRLSGTWEPMYTGTFFTLVIDRELYAPIIKKDSIIIKQGDWVKENSNYIFTYAVSELNADSLVEVNCLTELGFRAYSDLTMRVEQNKVIFVIPYQPSVELQISIIIQ